MVRDVGRTITTGTMDFKGKYASFGWGNQIKASWDCPVWYVPLVGRITTRGNDGKAHTREGTAWPNAEGRGDRGSVPGIFTNQVDLESQWEAVGNETEKWILQTKEISTSKTEVFYNRLVRWRKGERGETPRDKVSGMRQLTGGR